MKQLYPADASALLRRLPRFCWLALACCSLAGCGSREERAEVEGVVTLGGKPAANIEVVFLPDPELGSTGPRAAALTDEEGHYRLHADRGEDGAVVGKYRVLIVDNGARSRTPRPSDPEGEATPVLKVSSPQPGPKKSRVPARYGSVTSTPLQAIEVKSGKQRHDFNVKNDR
jgi:hypothetical protein